MNETAKGIPSLLRITHNVLRFTRYVSRLTHCASPSTPHTTSLLPTPYSLLFFPASVLLLATTVLLVTSCRSDDGSLQRVQATGVLRVGLDASFPPFESLDGDGNVIGFDADLAHIIAARLGAEPDFANVGFDGLYDALLAGRIDVIISGLPYDTRRTQDVIYSQPYFNAGQVLVVPISASVSEENGQIGQRLADKTVAVEWGSAADMEARRLQDTTETMSILPQPTTWEALTAVAVGEAQAAIADSVSVQQFMGDNPNQIRVAETLTDELYVIATNIHSRQLAEAIEHILADLHRSGQMEEMLARWLRTR